MELFYVLQLYRSEHISPISFHYLIKKFKSAKTAVKSIDQLMEKWKIAKKFKLADPHLIDAEIKQTLELGAKFLTYDNFKFCSEQILKFMPPVLIVEGNIDLLKNLTTVVGTRNPTEMGQKFCEFISKQLNKTKVILSELNLGIDSTAHRSGLEGQGTVAVLPVGIDQIYPINNRLLYSDIRAKGLLVTEHPIGTIAKQNTLSKRNNLASLLGNETIVIESPSSDSAAIITASRAHFYSKPVYAVPSHPMDSNYAGNNEILRKYAHVLYDIGDLKYEAKEEQYIMEEEPEIIWQKFQNIPVGLEFSLEELSHMFGYVPQQLLLSLAELEVVGLVEISPSFKITKIVS